MPFITGGIVNWEHYVKVHDEDKKMSAMGHAKVCPKITDDHFALGTSAKMRVSYATQVREWPFIFLHDRIL